MPKFPKPKKLTGDKLLVNRSPEWWMNEAEAITTMYTGRLKILGYLKVIISNGHQSLVQMDAKNSDGNSALHLACRYCRKTTTIDNMLESGATTFAWNNDNKTPFDLAMENPDGTIANYMIEIGINVKGSMF